MVVIHGTQRFRDRLPEPGSSANEPSSTLLGDWYATLLRWRRPAALLVNEATLLPVVVPFAPARTLLDRFPAAVADVLAAHHVPQALIDNEFAGLAEPRLEPTANRSVVGVMNEFSYLAGVTRDDYADDLLGMSVRLAATPCSPLYRRHVRPDRELTAFITEHSDS